MCAVLLITLLALVAPAGAADITISPGVNAIQDAINAGTTNPGDTIILTFGTYTEHDITVSKNIIIRADTANGHGPTDTIIDAQFAGQIFIDAAGNSLDIDNLTLRNGKAPDGAAGTDTFSPSAGDGGNGGNGGAISSAGPVTVTSSTITGCSAGVGGNGGASC